VGDLLNIEADVLGKYVVRLIQSRLVDGALAGLAPVEP
jgi:riboflavin synthase alpha subunit